MPGDVLATLQAWFLVKGTVTCPCLSSCHLTHEQHSTQLMPPSFLGQPPGFWDTTVSWFPPSVVVAAARSPPEASGLRGALLPHKSPWSCPSGAWLLLRVGGKGFGASHAATPHPGAGKCHTAADCQP